MGTCLGSQAASSRRSTFCGRRAAFAQLFVAASAMANDPVDGGKRPSAGGKRPVDAAEAEGGRRQTTGAPMPNVEAEGNRPGTAASTEALLRRSETLARVLSTAELVADAEAVSAAASAEAEAEAAAAEAEAVAAAEAAAKAEAAAAVEPRTPSSDAADAAGAAEVDEDVEADLIKGTLQYTEAQARLRGWLEPYPYPYPYP